MDVVLLGETLAEGSLECAEVGDGEFEDLRRLLAGHEEGGLGVLVLLRLALCHGALCAGILGFPVPGVSIAFRIGVQDVCIRTLTSTCCRRFGCSRCRTLGGTFS
jgi:hypothetical protein